MQLQMNAVGQSKESLSDARPSRATVFLVGLLLIVGLIVHWRRELILIVLHGMPGALRERIGSGLLHAAVALDGKGLWLAKVPVCWDREVDGWIWESLVGKDINYVQHAEMDEAGGAELAELMGSPSEFVVNRTMFVLWRSDLKRESQVERVIDALPSVFRRRDLRFLAEESGLVARIFYQAQQNPAYSRATDQIYEKAIQADSSEFRRYLRGALFGGVECQEKFYQLAADRFDDWDSTTRSEIVLFQTLEIEKRSANNGSSSTDFSAEDPIMERYRRLYLRLDLGERIDTAFMIARQCSNFRVELNKLVQQTLRPMVTTVFESKSEQRFDLAMAISNICEGRSQEFIAALLFEQWALRSYGGILTNPEEFLQTSKRLLKDLAMADLMGEEKRRGLLYDLYPKNKDLIVEWNKPSLFMGAYNIYENK